MRKSESGDCSRNSRGRNSSSSGGNISWQKSGYKEGKRDLLC